MPADSRGRWVRRTEHANQADALLAQSELHCPMVRGLCGCRLTASARTFGRLWVGVCGLGSAPPQGAHAAGGWKQWCGTFGLMAAVARCETGRMAIRPFSSVEMVSGGVPVDRLTAEQWHDERVHTGAHASSGSENDHESHSSRIPAAPSRAKPTTASNRCGVPLTRKLCCHAVQIRSSLWLSSGAS